MCCVFFLMMLVIYGDTSSTQNGSGFWGIKIVGTSFVDMYVPKARWKLEKSVLGSPQMLTKCSQPKVSFLHERQLKVYTPINLISILMGFNALQFIS